MTWDHHQIRNHLKAADILNVTMTQAFNYIAKNRSCTEWEVQQAILQAFEQNGLINLIDRPIVAFGKNTSHVHYYPDKNSSAKLGENSPILIDIWGKLPKPSAPYADITWMGYFGKVIPAHFKNVYNIVSSTRDKCVKFMQNVLSSGDMPTGKEVESFSRDNISNAGYANNIKHSLGHSIGSSHVHGKGRGLNLRNSCPLKLNLGYTIEPGIYLDGAFGVRSEIDFVMSPDMKLIISTPAQKEIVHIY